MINFLTNVASALGIGQNNVHVAGTLYSNQVDYSKTFNLYQGQSDSDVQNLFRSWSSAMPTPLNDLARYSMKGVIVCKTNFAVLWLKRKVIIFVMQEMEWVTM